MSADANDSAPDVKTNAKRALPFAAAAGVLQIIVALVGMLLLVRYLAPDVYGAWMILLGVVAPILLVLSIGHRQALIRFLPALESSTDRGDLLWSVVVRRLLAVVVGLLVVLALFPLLAGRFGVEAYRDVFVLLIPGFAATAANEYLLVALNTAFRQREVLVGAVAHQVVFVSAVAWGIWDARQLSYFAIVFSASVLLRSALSLYFCVRCYGAPDLSRLLKAPAETNARRHYRLISYLDDWGTMLLSSQVSRLIVAALDGTGQVALFAVASNVVDRLRALQPIEMFRPLATVSIFSRYEESRSLEDVNRMFRVLHATNLSVTLLCLVLFVPYGRELLALFFRPEYEAAYWPAVFLFAGMSIFAIPLGLAAQTLERPQALVWAKASVLVNLGLGIPLTREFGAAGMAFAMMAGVLVKNSITFAVVRMDFDLRLPLGTIGRFLAAGLASVLVMELTRPWMPLVFSALCGLVVYGGGLRVFRVLDRPERALLMSILPEPLQRPARWLLG